MSQTNPNRILPPVADSSGVLVLAILALIVWGVYAGVGWLWKKINPPPPINVQIGDTKGEAKMGKDGREYQTTIMGRDENGDEGGTSFYVGIIDDAHVSVRADGYLGMTVTIPIGTTFVGSPGECDLMSAETVQIHFPGVRKGEPGISEEVTVEVYCLDRWRPTPSSIQKISPPSSSDNSGSRERRSVLGLVECLNQHGGSHEARQIAVWMVSNNLINYSEEELVQTTLDHTQQEFIRMHGAQLAEMLRRDNPDLPDEILERASAKSEEELLQMYQALRPGLQQKVRDQVAKYRTEAGPLVDACGYSSSSLPFFKVYGLSSFAGWDHAPCQWNVMVCAARDIKGEVGQPMDVDGPTASCQPDAHWSMDHHIDSGQLPPGVDFTDGAHINGTPAEAGDSLVILAGDNVLCNGRSYSGFTQELRFHISGRNEVK